MKKILATFLALVMVLSSLCLPAVANQTTPTTADVTLTQADFVADADDYDEDENTTEMLARAKIEKAIATKTNAVILLGADITVDVSSTTVFPLLADNFYGSFYGDGHTITLRDATDTTKDATIALAFNTDATSRGVLFDTVGINISDDKNTTEVNEEWKSDALIYDLTVKGVNATVSDGTAKGSQFGTIAGSTQRVLTMNNVHVEGTLTKSSTAATNVGGLLGKANNTTYIYDCSFNGNITYTGTSDCTAGGIVGAVVQSITIEGCSVNADNQTDGKIEGKSRAGGVVGVINLPDMTKTAAITKKTEVYGTVTSPTIAGGLIGGVEGNGLVNMSRSSTTYSPTNYATVTSAARAGGIIGRVYSGGDAITPRITMNFVSNQGAVTGTDNDAGGMIGLVQNVSLATSGDYKYNIRIYNNSSNTGAVIGCNFVGGVIGRVKASGAVVQIENTTNTGSVKATAAFAGGFIGMSDGTGDSFTITDCLNMGAVEGKRNIGGIFAHQRTKAAAKIAITGCVNMGSVTTPGATDTTYYAGGIVGSTAIASKALEISDCLNFGTITNTKLDDGTEGAQGGKGGIYGDLKEANTTAATIENNIDFTVANAGTTAVLDSALLAMGEEGKAQMRYSNTLTDAGIRFKIDTNSALLTALTNAGYTYTLGSLMATKATATEAGALTKAALEGKLHSDVNTGAVVKDNQYAVAVNNIGADYYATEFQCAGYITLTKGNTTYTIYTEASEARSLAYVADAILDKNEETAAIEKYGATLAIFQAALPTE